MIKKKLTTQKKLRERFAEALEILGMNQTELAAEFQISQPRISNLISGQRPIRMRHEMALECVLRQRGKWPLPSMTPKAARASSATPG